MDKHLAMLIAAQLTQAAIGGTATGIPIDPTIKDPTLQARNAQTWEVFRIFYSVVVQVLNSNDAGTSWPPPTPTIAPSMLAGLANIPQAQLAAMSGPLKTLLAGIGFFAPAAAAAAAIPLSVNPPAVAAPAVTPAK